MANSELYKIKGIKKFSEFLKECRIKDVEDLSERNPSNLFARARALYEIHEQQGKLDTPLPTFQQIRDWVEEAKKLVS